MSAADIMISLYTSSDWARWECPKSSSVPGQRLPSTNMCHSWAVSSSFRLPGCRWWFLHGGKSKPQHDGCYVIARVSKSIGIRYWSPACKYISLYNSTGYLTMKGIRARSHGERHLPPSSTLAPNWDGSTTSPCLSYKAMLPLSPQRWWRWHWLIHSSSVHGALIAPSRAGSGVSYKLPSLGRWRVTKLSYAKGPFVLLYGTAPLKAHRDNATVFQHPQRLK